MSKIAINTERVIEQAKMFGLNLEYDSNKEAFSNTKNNNFLRFRHKLAPKRDKRFAIVIYTIQDMSDIVDLHIDDFEAALLDVGKYLKEQEIIKVLNLQH